MSSNPDPQSLQTKLQAHGSAVEMLRHAKVGGYDFPFPGQYTNWRDEQQAWQESVVLFDQSFHMTDVYFEGPDVGRLLSDVGVNRFAKFGPDRRKQFVACNHEGSVMGETDCGAPCADGDPSRVEHQTS